VQGVAVQVLLWPSWCHHGFGMPLCRWHAIVGMVLQTSGHGLSFLWGIPTLNAWVIRQHEPGKCFA